MKLDRKNIILTGASSGIGKEVLKLLADYQDIKIIAVARNIDSIFKIDGKVFPFSSDLSTNEGVDAVFDYAGKIFDRIDIFIANAGFSYLEKIDKPDWGHMKQIYSLNVFSQIYSLEKLISVNGNKESLFVSTNSCVAFISLPGYAFYCSTKAGLHHFMETFRYENNSQIRIMSVYPVATKTEFFNKAGNTNNAPFPFPVQSTEEVAKAMIKGIEKNKKKVYPSLLFRITYPVGRAFPVLLKLYSNMEKKKVRKWLT